MLYAIRMLPDMAGNHIAELLKARGMSQQDLADKINLSQPHVNRLIKGENALKPDHIRRIAKALQCSELEITDDYVPPLPPLTRQVLVGFSKLNEAQQEAYVRLLNSIVEPDAEPAKRRKIG